ncbi:MAG: hypothetical protein JXA78_18175 [Anaerolineales bacterium]|nr:hypothetical protein [Anaerolineales bacterium]
MKNIHFGYRTVPLVFLFVLLIAFAPVIPWLGLYWDDWPSLWFLRFFGRSAFPAVFSIDRPLLGGLFILTTSLVGESLIGWQVFGLLTRLVSGLVFAWMLNVLWPGRKYPIIFMALLYLIYPGFKQQYIPITYSQVYVVVSVFFVSLGTMILAYRHRQRFWPLILLSIATSALCMFTVEYYVGLELLRPLFLWLTMQEQERASFSRRALKTAQRWLPYVALLGVFVLYRLMHETPRGDIIIFDQLRAGPLKALIDLARTVLGDIIEVSLVAWAETLDFSPLFGTKWFVVAGYLVTLAAALALTIIFLAKLRLDAPPEQASERRWALEAIAVGLYALAVGGWPIWVTDLHIDLFFPWDRFTLLLMIGVSILFVGLLELALRRYMLRVIVIGLAVGLACGAHFLLAVKYRQDWSFQRTFFWQLAWRAPGLEPGTALMTPGLPFEYVTDNSLTAPLNWIYSPDSASLQMPYMMVNLDARLGLVLDELAPDQPIHMDYRLTEFNGSTSQVVLAYYDPPRCLKVFDPQKDAQWPNRPALLTPEAIQLSNPAWIVSETSAPAQPPAHIFGPEPEHDWCYYFEKAELARQVGDWQEIVNLGEQALHLDKDFVKETAPELMPFIEGYAHSGRWEQALELSLLADRYAPKARYMLCQLWDDLYATTPASPEKQAAYDQARKKLHCELP